MAEKKNEMSLGAMILELRKILRQQDWQDDGVFRIPSRPDGGYTYLTAEKTKRQFNLAMEQAGLNMSVEYSDLMKHEAIGNMSQHWTVKCTMTIYGGNAECVRYVAYGEAGDSGDKGVNKAQTDAIKQIIFNEFLVGDCSDPDANTSDIEVPAVGRRIPPSPAQKQETKEKMAQSQVKPAQAPKEEPKGTRTEPDAPKDDRLTPPQDMTEKKVPKGPAQAVQMGLGQVNAEGLPPANAIQVKAIQNILKKASDEVADGTMTKGEFDALDIEADEARKDSKKASEFIVKHRNGRA